MVTINENIRWYKPNDPYYYEVDNLPLIDLLNNDKSLRDAVQAIENANLVWASQAYVTSEIQSAVGNIGTIDLYGNTTTYDNVVDWVEGKGYLTSVLTKVGELTDVDAEGPVDGDVLIWKANELNSEGTLGVWKNDRGYRRNYVQEIFNIPLRIDGPQYIANGHAYYKNSAGVGDTYVWTPTTNNYITLDYYVDPSVDASERAIIVPFADVGLPPNTKVVYVGGLLVEAVRYQPPATVHDRSMQFYSNMSNMTAYRNIIMHVHANGFGTSVGNIQTVHSYNMVPCIITDPNNIANQTLHFSFYLTTVDNHYTTSDPKIFGSPHVKFWVNGYEAWD
tara:strand:- start:97 stop:1101 length:1005 start_codon:yes stop_codon:yes gene_type:complete